MSIASDGQLKTCEWEYDNEHLCYRAACGGDWNTIDRLEDEDEEDDRCLGCGGHIILI